jgi:hypothetical protein
MIFDDVLVLMSVYTGYTGTVDLHNITIDQDLIIVIVVTSVHIFSSYAYLYNEIYGLDG